MALTIGQARNLAHAAARRDRELCHAEGLEADTLPTAYGRALLARAAAKHFAAALAAEGDLLGMCARYGATPAEVGRYQEHKHVRGCPDARR